MKRENGQMGLASENSTIAGSRWSSDGDVRPDGLFDTIESGGRDAEISGLRDELRVLRRENAELRSENDQLVRIFDEAVEQFDNLNKRVGEPMIESSATTSITKTNNVRS